MKKKTIWLGMIFLLSVMGFGLVFLAQNPVTADDASNFPEPCLCTRGLIYKYSYLKPITPKKQKTEVGGEGQYLDHCKCGKLNCVVNRNAGVFCAKEGGFFSKF